MFAAGTTAPLGSVTVPTMVPDLICARATPQQSTVMAMRAQNFVEVARPIVDIRSRPPVANSFVWGPSQPLRSGLSKGTGAALGKKNVAAETLLEENRGIQYKKSAFH